MQALADKTDSHLRHQNSRRFRGRRRDLEVSVLLLLLFSIIAVALPFVAFYTLAGYVASKDPEALRHLSSLHPAARPRCRSKGEKRPSDA